MLAKKHKATTLRELRLNNKLTQAQAADRLGYTLSMYAKVEAGRVKASRAFMEKVTQTFPEADINALFFAKIGQRCGYFNKDKGKNIAN